MSSIPLAVSFKKIERGFFMCEGLWINVTGTKIRKGGQMGRARNSAILLITAIILISFVGCTTTRNLVTGRDFDETKREKIIKNVTTKKEVLGLYGEPADKQLTESYLETWIYYYQESNSKINVWDYSTIGTDRIKKLVITFDEKDVVKNFVYSDTTNPTSVK